MFNGMMDPELMKLAQEQMSRMSPADFARIQEQMMANPDLMKMASESMKNMRPEDLRHAAEQLKGTCPEEMAEIGEKMASASPEELAAMRARVDGQINYELNAAEMLKKQGNEFHRQGRFDDALEKYLFAKKNLKGIPSSRGSTLLLACSLNLMSCYLKTRQYHECIEEGSEVLAYDAKNVKALYRRGQAYKELGQFQKAVSDLTNALEVTPDDETVADVLRDAKEQLAKEGGEVAFQKIRIEEITEEEDTESTENDKGSFRECSTAQLQETTEPSKSQSTVTNGRQNFMSNAAPNSSSASSSGKFGEIPPDMVKTASSMINNMSPEELQKMVKMATSLQGANSYLGGGSSAGSNFDSQNLTPEILKMATNVMGTMSPEELQKMFEMASSLKGTDRIPKAAAKSENGLSSDFGLPETLKAAANGTGLVGETSTAQSTFANSSVDLQEQMRNQMKDPAMRQMFSSMMKNMSPDMMANMSEQFGLKVSQEDAAKVQQAMSSLSPEDLDRMMNWADKIQRGVEGAKRTKRWLLGRPGMILAILILFLAVILHWFGFIGR